MGGRLVMDEEQLFLFDDEPEAFPIENPDPELCPFCGGKPHINSKILRVCTVLEQMPWTQNACIPKSWPVRREHISVYVYCGRCRARGPIVARTLKRRSEEDEMKVEAIRKWNGMQGRT